MGLNPYRGFESLSLRQVPLHPLRLHPQKMRKSMTIGELAKAAGVSVEAVRYYQRRGLLHAPHSELSAFEAAAT